MPLPGFITKLFSGSIGDIVDKIGNTVDKFVQTKEEKDLLNIELLKVKADIEYKAAELEFKIDESYLKDTQDARSSNVKIQESDKASWLSKNTLPILTLLITTGFFGLLGFMLMHDVPAANKDILNIMLGSLGTAWITVVAFYFGSSQGSKANGEVIRQIVKNQ
jgi:hypothetical protein